MKERRTESEKDGEQKKRNILNNEEKYFQLTMQVYHAFVSDSSSAERQFREAATDPTGKNQHRMGNKKAHERTILYGRTSI